MPGCIYTVSKVRSRARMHHVSRHSLMLFQIAVGTLVCAPRGDGAIGSPAVWKLAKLLRLADYLTGTTEWKLTDLYLGVSPHAIEGTHTHSDALQIHLLTSALQAAVGTPPQV